MKVSEIMTKKIVTAGEEDTILDVAKMMRFHNIGCVPVVEEGKKVLGVITDRDIVLNMARFSSDPSETLAKEIASQVVYHVKPDAEVASAIALMKKQRIRRLPVMEEEKIVGMISLGDIAVHAHFDLETGEALEEISRPARVENI